MPKYISRVPRGTDLGDGEEKDTHSAVTERGPRIEIQDTMDIQDRQIFFSKDKQPQTKLEIIQEKSEAFKEELDSTNQYQKFVNGALKERMGDVKKLLDREKRFAEELNCFQETPKTKHELEKANPKYITENDTKAIISNLEQEYEKMKEKFEFEKSKIEKTKADLEAKKQQIAMLGEEMQFISKKEKKEQVPDDPVLTLKTELRKLGIQDDSGKISDALKTLSDKMNKNSK
ncbi:MAG TPA: hypothetical protein VFM64_04660 [Candidatus Nitrosotenuis sp.]|nr:hypothetical protein [Candidatus Nitrosotenuis sp.]